ncbi:MAG: DegT/DnrJ/EryC1/StrS family aminotransferase [Firmicutes bacterium]|nr:DegT/DnrJ/EryC1/StrS family aminotransferase [Bacillota bacterium]
MARRRPPMPLVEAVEAYVREGVVRFHMPGHKGGRGASPAIRRLLGERAFRADVTSVEGLDDLQEPTGVLAAAQALAAAAFGADRSYFLVNGTSAGVQAMILAATQPGGRLLLPRNMHKSALAGLVLSGAWPVWLEPEREADFGLALGVAPHRLEAALERGRAEALLLLSPNYYGVVPDLGAAAALARRRGLPLLVDEAHGPHFGFHPALPPPALRLGADASAQGAHKLLGGLTQASLLHLRRGRLSEERVEGALRLLQSTSASYLLMASLDAARAEMQERGRELVERAIRLADGLRAALGRVPGLRLLDRRVLGGPAAAWLDPLKVTVSVRDLGLSGREVELILRRRHRIQVEMSDLFNVVLIVGSGNTEEETERLVRAFRRLAAEAPRLRRPETAALLERAAALAGAPAPEVAVLPREAWFAAAERVELEAARGRVAAETVTSYPPGIPIVSPGERISGDVLDFLVTVREAGLRLSGPADPSLRTIRVLA